MGWIAFLIDVGRLNSSREKELYGMDLGIVKFLFSVTIANIIRLLRFIPNNDPIMAMLLPFSRHEKLYKAVLFPFITMVSFDIITGLVGLWTIVTSLTYAFLGLLFYFYFKRKDGASMKTYLGCGVTGVLIFDFVTGVLATPLLFGMSFEQAFVGQIPFTILHLLTVSGFIVVVTPLLDRHILQNKRLEDQKILAFLFRKNVFQ